MRRVRAYFSTCVVELRFRFTGPFAQVTHVQNINAKMKISFVSITNVSRAFIRPVTFFAYNPCFFFFSLNIFNIYYDDILISRHNMAARIDCEMFINEVHKKKKNR